MTGHMTVLMMSGQRADACGAGHLAGSREREPAA